MTQRRSPASRPRSRSGRWLAPIALVAALCLVAFQSVPAGAAEPVLGRFVEEPELATPIGWFARAEVLLDQWGTEAQSASARADLVAALAESGHIDAAEAVAERLTPGVGVYQARLALIPAYARANQLDKAEAMARVSVEPDGQPEPGAYCEFQCQIACALAEQGRTDDADKVLARLDNPPADWPTEWTPPASLVSIRARIHGALAIAHAKADRRDDYERHATEAERLAASIPGDVNELWGQMYSSSIQVERHVQKPVVDPMNGIYKSNALSAAVVARGKAGDFEAARKALETFPAGRPRDVIVRRLIETAVDARAIGEAQRLVKMIENDDHRGLAYLTMVPVLIEAGDRSEAESLAQRIEFAESRLLAQLHLALGVGGSGESGSPRSLMDAAVAAAASEARQLEAGLRRIQGGTETSVPRLRPDTCRKAAPILAKTYNDKELLAWIDALPTPDARFSALLGVGESLPPTDAPE